ncbi:Tf2-11, partial [Mucuna pruriens]
MPGIDPNSMNHRLSIANGARPVMQKKRKQGEEKRRAIQEETSKLLKAGFIREVRYPEWLANVVMVRKANGKWRMCTDYTDLNKVCPKDPYPLPNIDRLVDSFHGRILGVDAEEAVYIIQEVHEGVCGTHIGGRALARKISRVGYYWLTLKADCVDYVKRCDKCQRFADNDQAPTEQLHTVASPWPFNKWGIDILGSFPLAPGQLKFLMVVVDYFTKWVEAEPMTTITAERVKRFIWKKIICRFGLPAEIVSDNGTQFASSITTKFCQDLHIRQSFTSVEHPQANGQAEAANRVILRGLRRRLEEAKGRWAKELPQVIWSYHTTPHSTTCETPFRLMYRSEVVIPVEIRKPSPRTALFEPTANEDELGTNLDLLQEIREIAHIKEYAAKTRVARKYNRRVVYRDFEEGDLVFRKTTFRAEKNKLTPKWEGPFKISEKVGRGAYRLEHLDRRRISCTWNTSSLRRSLKSFTNELITVSVTNIYRYNDRPSSGLTKMGGVANMAFILKKASSHSGVHVKFRSFFSVFKTSVAISKTLEMKRDNAVTLPISY